MLTPPFPYQIYPLGDRGITIDFGDRISEVLNDQVMQWFHSWQRDPPEGVIELIPAYSSISVFYDPCRIRKWSGSVTAYEWMKQNLERILSEPPPEQLIEDRLHRIPVCYDTRLAPELETLAACLHLSVAELVHLHSAVTYRIYMLGFLPGFPYMGEVNERIALPRRAGPVPVKAGSVGIAGKQTGIYPIDSPGGWCIIGQTPLPVFDPSKEVPVWLQPGHRVQFYPVSLDEYDDIKAKLQQTN
jgi:inhibitor of KinA